MFVNNMDVNQREMYMYQEPALNCKVTLQNKELWQKFHELETEMIITKSGRRMFPALRVQLENLDPNSQYCVLVEMIPVTKCRYKYSSSAGWAPAGAEEAQSPNRIYLHPESPAPGHFWMSQVVTFGRLKLTNTANPPPGQVVLSSMHKYQPRIIIVKAADLRQIPWAPHTTASFAETQFIAVTAYQNDRITKLKIDNNPFAKGFRENGQSKCKRKRQQAEEQDEEIIVDDVKPQAKKIAQSEPSLSPRLDTSDASSERTSSPEQSPPTHAYPYMSYQYSYPLHPMDAYSPYYLYSPAYVNYYNPYVVPVAQDLSVQKEEKPKKLTDFSIRAITGLS